MKLNSTGSLSFSNGKYWSYSTKMSDSYNGYRLFNSGRYSTTTAKHQAVIRREYDYDIALEHCPYGDWDCEKVLKYELERTQDDLNKRKQQRKTNKQKEDIKTLSDKIELLNEALEAEDKTIYNKGRGYIMQIEEKDHKKFLEEKYQEVMHNHLCGNYISIEDSTDIEWFTNYDTEQFIALTEFGSFHHQYDWDSSYDSNLEAFIEDLFQFISNNREAE